MSITIVGMKWDTLFKHREFVITYEEIMADVEEYQKLLNSPTRLKEHKAILGMKRCTVSVTNQCIWKNVVIGI